MAVVSPQTKPDEGSSIFFMLLLQMVQKGLSSSAAVENNSPEENGFGNVMRFLLGEGTENAAQSQNNFNLFSLTSNYNREAHPFDLNTGGIRASVTPRAGLNDALNRGIQNAFQQCDAMGYGMGAKGGNGRIDCSGFVSRAITTALREALNVTGETNTTRLAAQFANSSEGQLLAAAKYGTVREGQNLLDYLRTPNGAAATTILTMDTGQRNHDRGRAIGIDHVVIISNGVVYESSSGQGVHKTNLTDWLKRDHGKVYGVDLSQVVENATSAPASPQTRVAAAPALAGPALVGG